MTDFQRSEKQIARVTLIQPSVSAPSDWRPIETAPKDGTEILLFTTHDADDYYDESFSAVQIGSWDHGNQSSDPVWFRPPGWECPKIGKPTHWMPLPSSPLQA